MGDAGSDDDDPDFFKNVYAQSYSRPVTASAPQRPPDRKRESPEGSTSPEKVDPNELPRDFSARGAKLWEEKAKASERNWKKRREDELTCKLCGEKGHFAQGCPTTLKKDVTIKVTVHDRRLKPRLIGVKGATIQKLEADSGCRMQLEDIPPLPGGHPEGSFRVTITAPDGEKAGRGRQEVERVVSLFEEAAKRGGPVWGGPGWGGVPTQPGVVGGGLGMAAGRGGGGDEVVMQQFARELEARRQWGGAEDRGGGGPGGGWQEGEGYPSAVRVEEPQLGFRESGSSGGVPFVPGSEGELEQYVNSRRAELAMEEGGEVEKEKKRHREKTKEIELRYALLKSQLMPEETRLRRLIPPIPPTSAYPPPYGPQESNGANGYGMDGYPGLLVGGAGVSMLSSTHYGAHVQPTPVMDTYTGPAGGYRRGVEYQQAIERVAMSYPREGAPPCPPPPGPRPGGTWRTLWWRDGVSSRRGGRL